MADRPVVLARACIKLLSATEADPRASNQHEFNGVVQLQEIFGVDAFERQAKFVLRGTDISDFAKVTWYDARRRHPSRSEYRLYFQTNSVMKCAHEGDNILIGFDRVGQMHCVLIPTGAKEHRKDVIGWERIGDGDA